MAGDWIKIRTDLYRDPKVCVMADILLRDDGDLARFVNQHTQRDMAVTRNVMRNVTVGALVSVWGVMRQRGKRDGVDLLCRSVSLSVIDDIADLPGLGEAMSEVGWAVSIENGVVFPRFFEDYNVDPEEKKKQQNAERQRRYREKKQEEEGVISNVTRNVTVTHREEKRRVEKNRDKDSSNEESTGKSAKAVSAKKQAEQIYAAYPRKVARDAALKAIANALKRPDVEFEMLLAAVSEYAKSREGKDPNLTPYPATWFNAGRWEDDRAEWFRDERNNNSRERAREPWEHLSETSAPEGPRSF